MQDMRHFKAMLRKVDNTYVRDHKLSTEAMEALREGRNLSVTSPSAAALATAAAVRVMHAEPIFSVTRGLHLLWVQFHQTCAVGDETSLHVAPRFTVYVNFGCGSGSK